MEVSFLVSFSRNIKDSVNSMMMTCSKLTIYEEQKSIIVQNIRD